MSEKKVATPVKESEDDHRLPSDGAAVRPVCGIVRPIADMAEYGATHWLAVHSILAEAAASVGYDIRLVSESDTAGIILNHIVTNLYSDPVVICDVSGRNPNVMFELGMRIAFEKPVIVIADDTTPFSFDISPLKHFTYPRSLRYADMVKFKEDIGNAIISTLVAFNEPTHRGYLQQFGPIEATKLPAQQVSVEGIAADLASLRRSISVLEGKFVSRVDALSLPSEHSLSDLIVDVEASSQANAIQELEAGGDFLIKRMQLLKNKVVRINLDVAARASLESASNRLRHVFELKLLKAAYPLSSRSMELLRTASIPASTL